MTSMVEDIWWKVDQKISLRDPSKEDDSAPEMRPAQKHMQGNSCETYEKSEVPIIVGFRFLQFI